MILTSKEYIKLDIQLKTLEQVKSIEDMIKTI